MTSLFAKICLCVLACLPALAQARAEAKTPVASGPLPAAYALLDAWQLEDAMAAAAQLLAQSPASPEARALAAEVMHQRGHHEPAMAMLGLGRLVDSENGAGALPMGDLPTTVQERLAEVLPQLSGSAGYAATFAQRTSPHFHIHYQDKDEIVATLAEDVLEAAYAHIGQDLGPPVAARGERIGVEIYPDAQGLAAATGLTLHNIEDSGTIAVCKYHRLMIISPLATATGYLWADTLAHELTHLIVSKLSHNHVPIWLHEGIAKYYETRWRGEAGTGLTRHSEGLLKRAVADNALIPFARMHPSMAKLPSQHDATLAFAEVFAMVELMHQTQGPKAIAHALAALGRGVRLDDVLVQHLGGTLDQLEGKLHRALKKRRFSENSAAGDDSYVRIAPLQTAGSPAPQIDAVADPQAADWLRLGEMLALRGHARAAIDPFSRAYARVGPSLPMVGVRLAQALRDQGQTARALDVVQKTWRHSPEVSEAQLLYAQLLAGTQAWAQMPAPLRAYCLRNPYNPEVHALWGSAAEHLGDAPTQAREAHFVALASAARMPRPAPPAPKGAAHLRLVTVPWTPVYLDDDAAPHPTPIWDLPIAPGAHTLRTRPAGPPVPLDIVRGATEPHVVRLGDTSL